MCYLSLPQFVIIKNGSAIMSDAIREFRLDEEGATALEYGLLAALIAAVIIGAVQAVGNVVSTTFNIIAANMATAS